MSQRTAAHKSEGGGVSVLHPEKPKPKPAAQVSERCGVCTYFVATGGHPMGFFTTISRGECRRYPPAFLGRRGAIGHPTVVETNWCGEFKKRLGAAS